MITIAITLVIAIIVKSRNIKMRSQKKDSLIYVNFAPYENAGGILDFFKNKFKHVALFSFNFHNLGKKGKYNKLKIYHQGKKVDTKKLFDFQIPEKLIFLFLPIRSIFIFFQIIFYTFYLRHRYGKFHYYFTVNAFTAWIGNILKKTGFVNKTLFWVWDYYPPFHENKIIVFMRGLYWQFDKWATKSNTLIFLSSRVATLRKEIGILTKTDKYKIVPVGTTNLAKVKTKNLNTKSKIKIVFFGVIKKSQGLDLIFDSSNKIISSFPNVEIDIIGAGPDLEYFKNKGKNSKLKVNYHGYMLDPEVDKILKKSDIGIAPYIPSIENEAFYGDPSKIKRYLSFGLPVITTNVFEFSREIKKSHAGILIDYKTSKLIDAIAKVVGNYTFYQNGAKKLGKKYYYKNLYPNMFTPY